MNKKTLILLLGILLLTLAAWLPAQAQSSAELTLKLSRDFGYSSGTGQIQGTFSMKVSGPDNLKHVTFLLDGNSMGEASAAPFNLKFNTDNFPLGIHTLSATGTTSDGGQLASNEIKVEFVSASEGTQAAMRIIFPVLAIVFGAILLGVVLPAVLSGRKNQTVPLGTAQNYGFLGGTICPKCKRPFAVHMWGINLGIGKLDRCPHCGKWSIVRRVPLDVLRAVESAEKEQSEKSQPQPLLSEEERLKKELENSRYQDL